LSQSTLTQRAHSGTACQATLARLTPVSNSYLIVPIRKIVIRHAQEVQGGCHHRSCTC
jgi:hypothetical protein